MKCYFCEQEFDARFNVGDAYEGLQLCPGCRRFNQVSKKLNEEE